MPEIVNTSALPFDENNEDENSQEDNRSTAIKVENVSMVFNMASERLNNLKEYFLKIVKHELFFEELMALDNISFEVKKGDVFGILGTNGSGKSTLLKIVAGVLEPTCGKVEINGAIAPLIELGAGFDMDLSARENIYLNGALLGYSKEFIQEHFDDIVEFAEVEKFLDMPMKNYSSGMVARIAFSIATVMVPEILIVDEVLSVGDFMFQQKCEDRINELIERHGVTVLIVSHSNDQIERLCNKAIWIEKGHCRIMGNAKKVCDAYRVLGGRIGSHESEQQIYDLLRKTEVDNHEDITKTISTREKMTLKLFDLAWPAHTCKYAILVPDNTKAFALSAMGLAGYLDSAVFSYNIDNLEALHTTIDQIDIPNALIICTEETLALLKDDIHGQFISVDYITIDDNLPFFPAAILVYGMEKLGWTFGSVDIASIYDNCNVFDLAIQSYEKKEPLILIDDNRIDEYIEHLLSFLLKYNIKSASIHGQLMLNLEDLFLNSCSVKYTEEQDSSDNNCPDTLFLTTNTPLRWLELISCIASIGKLGAKLIILDATSLDSFSYLLNYTSSCKPSTITILGADSFSNIERKIIVEARYL